MMTTDEQIESHQGIVEVAGSKFSEALMKIRERGGFIPGFSVDGSKYKITVHWKEEPKQKELL